MKTTECYTLLAERGFHESMREVVDAPYAVVGGLALQATLGGVIDWKGKAIQIDEDVKLPAVRGNGTRRDADILVVSTKGSTIQRAKEAATDCVGDTLVVSTFGLRPYKSNRRGLLDFVGDRYYDGDDGGSGSLYVRLGGQETQMPMSSVEPWPVVNQKDEVVFQSLNPVAQLGAYMWRSVTGIRPKDKEKVEALSHRAMPAGRIKDLPAAYREELLAASAQAEKVRQARERMGWTAVKAIVLGGLEQQDWAVRLAQGSFDGLLASVVGKQ